MELAKLILGADTTGLKKGEADLKKLASTGESVERRTKRSTDNIAASYRSAAAGIAAATAAALALARALRGAEQYTKMTNSLRAIGFEGDAAAAALRDIADVAARTRAPLEATAQLYQRISIASKELGASNADVLRFTENVGLALAQTGTSAQQASGALLQLSQAMGSGVVRAEEFNSILEGAFPIAQAAANGIEGAAGSVAKLRQMVIAGEISSREFFEAILKSTDALEGAFGNTVPTVSGALETLSGKFTMFIGEMDTALGVSAALARAILVIGNNVERLAFYAAAAAAAFAVSMTPAIIAATLAAGKFVAALVLTRAALIRTGIGAAVVIAGELAYRFAQLVKATGSWGAALALLGDVAKGVWDGIATSAGAIVPALGAVWETIKAGFLSMVASLQRTWADFLHAVAGGLRDVPGAEDALMAVSHAAIMAGSAVYETEAAVTKLQDSAAALKAEAQSLASKGFDQAAAAAKKLTDAVNGIDAAGGQNPANGYIAKVKNAADDATDSLDDMGGALADAGKSAKEAAGGVKDLTKELESGEDAAKAYAEAMQGFVENGIERLVDNMVDGFKGGLKSIKSIFVDTIKQMIAFALKNKIMISLGMGGGGIAGAASASTGLGGMVGSLFGGVGTAFMAGAKGLLSGGISGALGAISSATGAIGSLATAAGALALPVLGVAAAFSFFKSKTTLLDKGLKVTANSAGTLVTEFEKLQKKRFWGLSKKNISTEGPADAGIAGPIMAAVSDMRTAVTGAAKVLGFGTAAFDRFSHSFQVSLKGLTEEQAMKAINDELVRMGDRMASIVPHISSMNELLAVASERWQLQNRILELQGKDAQLLARVREQQLNATHALNKGLLQTVFRLEDMKKAAEVAAEAAARAAEIAAAAAARAADIAEERWGVINRLLELRGKGDQALARIREREMAATDASNRRLLRHVYALEDQAKAADEAAKAADAAAKALNDLDPNDFATRFAFQKAQAFARQGIATDRPVFSASSPAPVATDAATVVEMGKWLAEMRAFRDEQRQLGLAISSNTKSTKDTLRKFDVDGMPAVRT